MLPQRRLVCYSNTGWYVTPTQVGMLLQHRLVCYPSAGWYATPTQAGMLPQRRLICYSNAGWYVTPTHVGMLLQQRLVHYSNESVELLMMYGFVKLNKTMVEVCRSVEAVMMIVPRKIPSSLRGSVKFFSQILCELMSY
jgi:hypothetical protein